MKNLIAWNFVEFFALNPQNTFLRSFLPTVPMSHSIRINYLPQIVFYGILWSFSCPPSSAKTSKVKKRSSLPPQKWRNKSHSMQNENFTDTLLFICIILDVIFMLPRWAQIWRGKTHRLRPARSGKKHKFITKLNFMFISHVIEFLPPRYSPRQAQKLLEPSCFLFCLLFALSYN